MQGSEGGEHFSKRTIFLGESQRNAKSVNEKAANLTKAL
jgi:hypothetical protein